MSPRQKKLLRRALAVFLSLVALGLVFSWLIGSALIAPAQGTVALPPSFTNTAVQFPSPSGATLRGNFLKGAQGRGVVVLMHGVRGNRGAMAKHAQFLHAQGFSVLIFDFQAHGESSGQKITSGYLESMDAAAAVAFARRETPNEKLAILGVSLGGAAALLANPPIPADAMILELVYADIDRAIKNRIAIVLGNWARPLSVFLTGQIKWRVGVPASWFSPERAIANVTCPKLIIAGAKDRHTTLADSQSLYAAAREPKQLWLIDNAAHENLHTLTTTFYEQRIVDFLNANITASPRPQ